MFRTRSRAVTVSVSAVALMTAAALAGCSSSGTGAEVAEDGSRVVETTNGVTFEITPNEELRSMFPEDVIESGKFRIAADPSYPPSTFKDESDNIVGFSPDMAELVAAHAGLEIEWTELPFDGLLGGLQANRFNAAWAGFSITPERLEVMNMVTYMQGGTSVIVSTGNPSKIADEEDLCGKVVGVQTGTIQAQEIMQEVQDICSQAGLDPIQPLELQRQTDVTQAITAGRADAGMGDSSNIGYFALQEKDRFEVIESILLHPVDVAIGIPKDDLQFAEALEATFNAMIDDGSYQEVLDSWNLSSSAIEQSELNPQG